MIKYKAEWYGRTFIQIDPFYPSTRTCHNCGHIHEYLPPNIREWTCPQCGKHHQRDINAAINIKNEGLRIIFEQKIQIKI
jgi:putative transposase